METGYEEVKKTVEGLLRPSNKYPKLKLFVEHRAVNGMVRRTKV